MDEQEELIEKYLDGLLTETELTHFETELAHNEELTKRVSIEKDLLEGIESFGNLDLKKTVKTYSSRNNYSYTYKKNRSINIFKAKTDTNCCCFSWNHRNNLVFFPSPQSYLCNFVCYLRQARF